MNLITVTHHKSTMTTEEDCASRIAHGHKLQLAFKLNFNMAIIITRIKVVMTTALMKKLEEKHKSIVSHIYMSPLTIQHSNKITKKERYEHKEREANQTLRLKFLQLLRRRFYLQFWRQES